MRSKLDMDNFEADLWEVEQTVKEIDKIIHGDEKDFQAALEKEKQLKQKEEHKKILAELKAREYQEKLMNGYPGKGEGKNYEKFCPHCFYEYELKDLDECTHCHNKLITREERHKILKAKLEVYKEKCIKKNRRRKNSEK